MKSANSPRRLHHVHPATARALAAARPRVGVGLLCAAVLMLGAAAQCLAQAEEEEPTFSYGGELEIASRYVWRGIELSDGAVAEPLAWASAYGFTLSGWGNVPLEGTNNGSFDEVDWTLGYSATWGKLKIEPAISGYYFYHQEGVPDTAELSLALAYPVGAVELFLEHNVDISAYSGAYFDRLGATWTGTKSGGGFTPAVQVAFGLGSSKFNEAYIGPSVAALNFAMADLGVTWEGGGAFYARAHVCLLTTVDETLRAELPLSDMVFGGVVFGVEL